MKRTLLLLVSGVALFAAPVCWGAASPWDGTWKLNQAKSKMTGDVFTLTSLPNGGFHLSTPSKSFEYDYTCDGKDYPVVSGRTGTCMKIDETHYDMAGKMNGEPDWHGTSVISEDGKQMTNTAYVHRPDGTDSVDKNTYERVGTGTGRAGTWRNVKSSASVADVLTISLAGDTMRSEMPAYKMVMTAKLDGSLATLEGPTVAKDFTIRVTADSPTKLHYVEAFNGKTMAEGTQTVSADGKTLVEVEWEPGGTGEKQTYVYEKQ